MSAIALSPVSRLKVLRRSYPAPERGDRRYVRLTEQTLDARDFNGVKRVVRRVVVAGMDLKLDEGDSAGLLKATRGADDVAEVYIVADSVTISTALSFPGADVYVYARSLTFANEQSVIDTSPPQPPPRDPRIIDGRDGLPAGDVMVVVAAFQRASPAAWHFRAVGGPGERGDDGGFMPGTGTRKDVPPVTKADWDKLMSASNRKLNHENIFWKPGYYSVFDAISFDQINATVRNKAYGGTLTYAEINNQWWTTNVHTEKSDVTVVAKAGSKDLPGRGADAAPPGRAGTGGPAGTFTGVPAAAGSFWGEGGESALPEALPGGPGGSPARPVWAFIEGRPAGAQHLVTIRLEAKADPSPGAWSANGQSPRSPRGREGTVKRLNGVAAQAWANAVSLATVLDYVHDALTANDWATGLQALEPYLDVCAPVTQGTLRSLNTDTLAELTQATPAALGDLEALAVAARRAVAIAVAAQDSLDEYGNPVGWAPSVSLDTAVNVYSAVLDGAMSQLNLSYTLQHGWSKVSQRAQQLDAMIDSLTKATEQARSDLVDARATLVTATSGTSPLRELSTLLDESERAGKKLTTRLEELSRQADEQQLHDDVRHAIAAGLEIGGALVKAIPLPEPIQTITGGVGTLAQITATFVDQGGSDAAFDDLQAKVKAFAGREDLADAFTTDLDAATGKNDQRSAELTKRATTVADKVATLQETRDATKAAQEARDRAATASKEAFDKAAETARTRADIDRALAIAAAARKREEADSKLAGEQRKLEAQQRTLEAEQKELENVNTALANAKSERVKSVKAAAGKIQQVATGVAEVGKAINKLMVYESTLDARWAKTLVGIAAKDDKLAEIKRQIDYLNQRKLAVALAVKTQERRMETAAETINRNAVALVELRAQHARTRDALDPQALAYIQAAQRDAQRTLARFLYYVVKAYEYYTVTPWSNSQYAIINQIFDKLGVLLASAKDADATTIRSDDLLTLKAVYEAPLTAMAREIADNVMTGRAGRQDVTSDHLTLPASVLAQLNASLASSGSTAAATVKPAALGWLDIGKERQRIRRITVESVSARKMADSPLPERIVFKFVHTGQSIVRSDGRLFAFVASDARADAPLRASVTWETRASGRGLWQTSGAGPPVYELVAGKLEAPTPGDEGNLLSTFMKDTRSSSELAKLSRFRPGGFSELMLLVEVSPPSARLELSDMVVTVEQEAVDDMGRAMVAVLSNVDAPVTIQLSRPDLSGSNFGPCELFAIFDREDLRANPVELTAPPRFAGRPFMRWVIDGREAAREGGPSSVIVNQSCQAFAEYGPVAPSSLESEIPPQVTSPPPARPPRRQEIRRGYITE